MAGTLRYFPPKGVVTPMPVTSSTTARFGLSLDQLHLLEQQCPTIALPPEFHIEWEDAVPIAERAARDHSAEQGLINQGLLSPGASDVAARVSPVLLGFLGLFADPALVLGVRSWNGERTFIQSIAILSGFAVSLVRTQQVGAQTVTPLNEDTAELSAFELPETIAELLRSLTVVDGLHEHVSPGAWTILPIALAQGLIEAIRGGHDEIIEAAAIESGRMDALPIVARAAGDIAAGFTFFATSIVTGEHVALHWFRSADGWFELSASTPVGAESVGAFVDNGAVRISTSDTSPIVAAVTVAVAALTGALRGY